MAEQHEATSPPISNPSFATMTEQQATSADVVQVQNLMKDILQEQDYPLQVALYKCLPQVAAEMFSIKMIPESVKEDPTYDKVIGECKVGMGLLKDVPALQTYWQLFLKILSNQSNPAVQGAARYLDTELRDRLISLDSATIQNPCTSPSIEADVIKTIELEPAKARHDKAAKFHLKFGTNTNAALYEAAIGDDNEAAQLLLNLGASADIALFESAKVGHGKAARFLLNLEASADIALLESAKVNHDKAALFLLMLGAHTNVALYEAAKGDDNEAAQFLLNLGASADIALLESAKVGHDKAAQFLLNLGASADIVLLESAKVNHDKAALFLLKLGAHTNVALYEAAKGDNNEIARFLITLGANKAIALLESAKVGHNKAAQFLLKLGANTDVALYEAAKGEDNEAARFLIKFGASTTISLLESAKVGHDKAAQFLLKLGANTNVALFEAAKGDNNEAVQFLLDLGSSTDAGRCQLEKIMKDLLQERHHSLQVAFKNILPQVAAEMFSIKMIPESVKDNPNYDKLIDEFKGGIEWQKDVPSLQKYWQSFLKILSSQGGAAVQGAADYLDTQLSKRLRSLKPASIQSTYTFSSIEEDVKTIELDSEVIVLKQVHNLHQAFTGLMRQVRAELNEEIQNQTSKTSLSDIARYVQDYISWKSLDLSQIDDLDGLFKELHRFYDFLDCDIIVAIAKEYLTNSDLSKKLQNHSNEAIEFRNTQSVKTLRNGLMQIYNPHIKNPENAPISHIKLKETWNQVHIEGLYLLIKHFLPNHEKQSLLNHIKISAGSVLIKYIVRESQVDHLIAYAQGKLQFMRLIGMFSLVINDTPILDDEDENENFTFDVTLLEAAKVGHPEAVQFILELGASVDAALFKAAKVDNDSAAQFLLNFGASTDVALHEAAKEDDNEAAQFLFNLGASADIALLESAKVNHDKAALFLLKLGAHTNVALYEAAKGDDKKAVQFLLNLGASTDANEMPKCKLQETPPIQSGTQKEEQVQCSLKAPSKTSTITEPEQEMQCTVTNQDKIQNVIKNLLEEQRYPLQVVLKDCLPQVATEMFSKKLISQSIKDDPTCDKTIDEFVAGMKSKDIHELQDLWKSFLQILSNQCPPACDAAIHLMSELSDNEIFINSEGIRNIKVNEDDKVLKELRRLQLQFAPLMTRFKRELKGKVKDEETCEELTDYVLNFIPMAREELNNIQDLNELLKKLHPYFDFLDCQLIVEIAAEYVTEELSKDIQEHSTQAANFRSSQSIEELRDCLIQIYNPHLKNPENAPKAHIKLNKPWNQVNIEGLYLLIKHFLPQHEKQSLINHITISAGSVLIKYIVNKSQVDYLIAYAQDKLQFMRLIGMFSLVINDTPILSNEDENKNFTFDVALLEAAKVGHIEAVQFLLELGASVNTALLKALQDDQIEAVSVFMELGGNIDDALLEAAKNGQTEAVQFLLELGASVDIALLKAVQLGQNEAVSILMELGGNIDDALLEVAKVGQIEAVSLLLKYGARINYRNENGLTPLMLATLGGHEQVVQTLVSTGANVNIQVNEGCTALMIASEKGHTQVIKLLLKENADVNIQANNKVTALMLASLNGHIEVVELLLKKNADINTQGQNGVTALMLASQNGHTHITELLLKENTDVNIQDINGWTAIMIACINGNTEVAELLLKGDADVNIQETNGMTALMLASQNGYTTIAELLLKKKVDVNSQEKKGWTALMKASRNGHAEVAQLLFKGDADTNIQGKNGVTALMLASQYGHTKVAEQLLKQNADVNIQAKNGFFALMLASLNGHTQVAELLLRENANINIQTKNGWTALMIASQNGHTQVAELLLKADADVNIQDEDGLTALMLASQKGDAQLVELLLNANTDVNIQAKNGVTALMLASQNGHAQVVELLVELLVEEIDFQGKSGSTALMLASINGHVEVAECLLQSHADPHIIAYNGATAFSLAAYCGNRDLVNMLLDKSEPTINEIEKAIVLSCYGGHPTLVTFLLNKLPHLTNNQRELLDSCVKGDLGAVIIKILDSPDTPLVLGLTPLMVASSCGHVDIVDALIQAGADVNKQENHLGFTPLFFAVKGGQSSLVVETLLMYGAIPNIITATNETPLDIAIRVSETFQMDAISKLLIKYGGQTTLQLQGGNKSEPKTLFPTFDELKTTSTSLQTTQKMQTIQHFEDKEHDKARISSFSSFIDLFA